MAVRFLLMFIAPFLLNFSIFCHSEKNVQFIRLTPRTDNAITKNNISHPRIDENRCQDMFTRFAYDQNLCGASDVNHYIVSKKAQFSCANRCGQTRKLSEDCACDNLCVVYQDCCRDMRQECADLHNRSVTVFSHVTGARLVCTGSSFVYLTGREKDSSFSVSSPSTVLVTHSSTPSSISFLIKEKEAPVPPTIENKTSQFNKKVLREYLRSSTEFGVVDLTYGLIFDRLTSFKKWRTPTSRPSFVPKISVLACFHGPETTMVHQSAPDILLRCSAVTVIDATTNFHRMCRTTRAISCQCGDDHAIWDHIHDSCQGEANALNLYSRYEESWKNVPHFMASKEPKSIGKCVNSDVHVTSSTFNVRNEGITGEFDVLTMKIMITPTLSTIHRAGKSSISVGQTSSNEEEALRKANQPFEEIEEESLEYEVELTETTEKRLRCERRQTYITDCVLEECVKGALLSLNPLVHKHFGGRSCVLPVLAEAVVPLCTCMRLMAALNELQVWKVTLNHHGLDNGCSLQLKTLPEDRDDGIEGIYSFDARYDQLKTLRTSNNLNGNVETKLQKLLEETTSKAYCADDNVRQIHICFHAAKKLDQNRAGHAVCMKIPGNGAGQATNRKGVSSQLTLSLLTIASFGIAQRFIVSRMFV
ncbi:vitronectin [Plakobranchus ocellatus]|uniref:Vitronectin n=1 Tax=Plakobranchus ocellatus TaxID=259542 RepID=A0AAV3YN98_9GAST|nr:vitronectin [Plakobranchus ocellatus]